MVKRIAIVFAAVLVLLLAGAAGYRKFVLVDGLRASVLAKLSDPASAQFRNERYTGNWTKATATLCGEVNAKNQMGGYAGFQWFIAFDNDAIIEDAAMREYFDKQKPDRCSSVDKTGKSTVPWWWLRY